MYFWITSIACPKLSSLYTNYTTIRFFPVVRKWILDIMLPLRIINQSSILSLEMLCESIFRTYILDLRVYFSRVSCLFFKPTSSLREFILVESIVYFLSLHPRFERSPFQSSQNKPDTTRDRLTFGPITNSFWSNNIYIVKQERKYKKRSGWYQLRQQQWIQIRKFQPGNLRNNT